jgi:hypothetical protein
MLSEIVRVCHKPPPFFFSLPAMIVNTHAPNGKRDVGTPPIIVASSRVGIVDNDAPALTNAQECGPALRISSETWDSNLRKFSRKRSASFLACSS